MISGGVHLVWAGKREAQKPDPVPDIVNHPKYGFTDEIAGGKRLIAGDNLAVMSALLKDYAGKFALLYLDPPFFTGKNWKAGKKAEQPTGHSEGGDDTPPRLREENEQIAFTDHWNNDLGNYLQWLYDRLAAAKELLAEQGSLYLHLNWNTAHYAKLLLDEILGVERFQNEIIWCYREGINSKKRWNRKHDTLLFYSKSDKFTFNVDGLREPYSESHLKKYKQRDAKGAYRLMGRGIVGSPLQSHRDLPAEYETRYPGLTYRHYLGEGTLPVDYWHIDIENQASRKRTGYPTQKPEALLERILLASSNPGDLIGDFCCGSGTALVVAERLGRRWIGCDCGELAIDTTFRRLKENAVGGFTVERAI